MTDAIKVHRTKAFKVVMSRGDAIQIDEDEVDLVVEGMNTGQAIIVKRGVINPSYLVSIEQDKDRIEAFRRDCQATYVEDNGKTQGLIAYEKGIEPLESIFGKTKIGLALEEKHKKMLGTGAKQLSKGN